MNKIHLSALVLLSVLVTATLSFTALAQSNAAKPQTAQEKRPYTEIILDKSTTDAKAVKIITKLLAADIKDYKFSDPTDPVIHAHFMQLGPNLPKTAIIAEIRHFGICGSSGCRIVAFAPTGKGNEYRLVFDTQAGRLFQNTREGQSHTDFLTYVMPRATDGFGVYFWSEKKGRYELVGVSKFK